MILMKIVGLSNETVYYQIKVHGIWKQYTKEGGDFIRMMYKLFPVTMKRACAYDFTDKEQLLNWLYNYGEEIKPCETYIFCSKCE